MAGCKQMDKEKDGWCSDVQARHGPVCRTGQRGSICTRALEIQQLYKTNSPRLSPVPSNSIAHHPPYNTQQLLSQCLLNKLLTLICISQRLVSIHQRLHHTPKTSRWTSSPYFQRRTLQSQTAALPTAVLPTAVLSRTQRTQ